MLLKGKSLFYEYYFELFLKIYFLNGMMYDDIKIYYVCWISLI